MSKSFGRFLGSVGSSAAGHIAGDAILNLFKKGQGPGSQAFAAAMELQTPWINHLAEAPTVKELETVRRLTQMDAKCTNA